LRFLRFKSLRAKVLLAVLLPGAIVLAVVADITLVAYERIARDVVERRDTELARVSAARLGEALDFQARSLLNASLDEDIRSLDRDRIRGTLAAAEAELFVYDGGVAIYDEFGRLAFFFRGQSGVSESPQTPLSLPQEFTTRVRSSSQPVYSDILLDPRIGRDVIVVGVPILDESSLPRGMIAGISEVKASLLSATLASALEFKAGGEGFAYIADGNGRIISHPDATLIGDEFLDIQPVFRATRGETGASVIDDPGGNAIVSGYAPVEGTRWGLVTQEPWDNVSGAILNNTVLLLSVMLVGGLIGSGLIFFFVGRTLRPIRELSAGAERIASGDFDHFIDAGSSDEVQELAQRFNTMAAALKESYEGLEQTVTERTSELRESEARLQGVIVNLTNAQEALQRQTEDLMRSNADLEQFAYVASHDLQEPLRSIVGFSRLLSRRYEGQLGEDADNYIQRTVNAAKRMQELINDLLAYSRIGRGEVETESIDCVKLVAQVIGDLQPVIQERGTGITHNGLPTVQANSFMLAQIFLNLIGNAVKFGDSNDPKVRVEVQHGDGEWVFSVADNGIGIDSDYLDRIFVIFQRLHSRSEYEGTGIGLAICKKAVERMGGRIWLESTPGEGTTFYFTIPAKEDSIQ